MEVRKYQDGDYDQVEKIYNVSRPDEFYGEKEQFSYEPWSEDEYIQSILKESEIYVCEENGIVGFCGYRANHINWLFVSPEFRGRGVASQLLAFVMPLMGAGITLTVGQSNERANKLYSKFGFVVKRHFIAPYQSSELAVSTLVFEDESA